MNEFTSPIVIVGCGGVASYLLPCLLKTAPQASYLLIDGDTLEERNIDRQHFDPDLIGHNKATALSISAGMTNARVITEYFHSGFSGLPENAWYFGCADNHTARKGILDICDQTNSRAVIGGNEYTDAEAFYYEPFFYETPRDPRIYYPDILTDKSGDPMRPRGCTGEAVVIHPQLAISNMMAAAYMLHLFWFHAFEKQKLDLDVVRNFLPIRHSSNFNKIVTAQYGNFSS